MSKQEEIESLRRKIEIKEGDLYRAEKEMNAWSKGKYKGHSNAKISKLFVKSTRSEIANLYSALHKLKRLE